MTDHWSNRLPSLQTPPQPSCPHSLPLPGQIHRCLCLGMTTVTVVHKYLIDHPVRQAPDLVQRRLQRMPVIGIPRQGHPAENKSAPVRGRNAHLHAELVSPVCLALTDALHFRYMQTLQLVPILLPLQQQPPSHGQLLRKNCLQVLPSGGLSFNVPDNPAQVRPHPVHLAAHAPQLPCMGIPVSLQQRLRALAGVAEIPSDLGGVEYIKLDQNNAWKFKLAKEFKEAGIEVDMNKSIEKNFHLVLLRILLFTDSNTIWMVDLFGNFVLNYSTTSIQTHPEPLSPIHLRFVPVGGRHPQSEFHEGNLELTAFE